MPGLSCSSNTVRGYCELAREAPHDNLCNVEPFFIFLLLHGVLAF